VHFGAELSHDIEAIECLCETCPADYINRQDDLGWTPLHYGLVFEFLRGPSDPLAKIRCLIRNGADPTIKATYIPSFCTMMNIDEDEFTAFDLSESLLSGQHQGFLSILQEYGYEIPKEAESNIFYDAIG
jgi:hypothetical protein